MRAVRLQKESEYIEKFVRLPADLYPPRERTSEPKTERALLQGEHVLSHYFETAGFLVLDDDDRAQARCMVTLYPGEEQAYIGFFECADDAGVSELLFAAAHDFCAENGRKTVVGPVDSSFWIKYRLKTDRFGMPYTGEPYNKPYYERLFAKAGYETAETYYSTRYRAIEPDFRNERYEKRLRDFEDRGCIIKSPEKSEYSAAMAQVYDMIDSLYADFPTFRHITRDEFLALYAPMEKIIDLSMVLMAYDGGEPVGFFVCLPDFGADVCGGMTPGKLMRIIRTKHAPERYILLYLGAKKEYAGLGSALVQVIEERLKINKAASIGALVKAGKVTGGYFPELAGGRMHYILLKKEL
jgi:GNAT superfamily N-acetyltransferase